MNTKTVQARLLDPLTQASGPTLPDDIQWMPPGRHVIEPLVAGEPVETEIVVDAELAQRVQTQFRRLLADAHAGKADKPFLDFNHADDEASAHVLDLYWGGDDPKTGGIRAKVKWTDAGRQALNGRSYRRFSPTWFVGEESGDFQGIGENLGGLVNRAAFRTIQPVVARSGDPTRIQSMNEADKKPGEQSQLADILKQALQPLVDQIGELKALLSPEGGGADAAKPGAVAGQLATARASTAGRAQAQAKAAVDVHARRGVFPPQNVEVVEFWERNYLVDPDRTERVLAMLPSNPVLGVQYTAGRHQNRPQMASGTAEGFVALVTAKAGQGRMTKEQAIREAVQEDLAGYQAWRDAGGKMGI